MAPQEVTGTFTFEQDTKRMHRFKITTSGGDVEFNGSLYITKDGPGIPKRIVLTNPNFIDLDDED